MQLALNLIRIINLNKIIMYPDRLTKSELIELSKYIDMLDATVGLSSDTINEIRARIQVALQTAKE